MSRFMVRACACLMLSAGLASAEPLKVRHHQGEVHAFLAVRSDDGKLLGMADEVNAPFGKGWRSQLTIRLRDGSVDDDTTVYTQNPVLRLLTDHHVQKGPSFPKPSDITIDMAKNDVTYHEVSGGRDEVRTEHMDLPADLSNGMMPIVLQNYPRGAQDLQVAYVVATPKPRLVKFAIHPDGLVQYRVGGAKKSASRYRLHVEIGGLAGLIAPMVGKEPPDLTAWVSTGTAPTFLKLYSFLYLGGPMWRLEVTSPAW